MTIGSLTFNTILANLYVLFVQTRKVLFSGRFYYVFGFCLAWIGMFVGITHFVEDSGMPGTNDIFYVLNLVPMLIMALYVSMMLVTYEKDNHTIETMFSVPGSPYKVWSYKLIVSFSILLFLEVVLALISFFFLADFEIFTLIIHAYIPVVFVACFNFFLSVKFRNGYAAGLVSLIVLFINFILAEEIEHSAWFLYLSPFNKPYDLDDMLWSSRLLYNKAGVLALAVFFMYLGLNKLRHREPFID